MEHQSISPTRTGRVAMITKINATGAAVDLQTMTAEECRLQIAATARHTERMIPVVGLREPGERTGIDVGEVKGEVVVGSTDSGALQQPSRNQRHKPIREDFKKSTLNSTEKCRKGT